MTSIHYCVSVTQINGFHTYGFQHPVDLVDFLLRSHETFRIVAVNHIFEILYEHPVYLGTVSSD